MASVTVEIRLGEISTPYLFQTPLNLAPGHAARVERDDVFVEAVETCLPLLEELRLELTVTVTGHVDPHLPVLAP